MPTESAPSPAPVVPPRPGDAIEWRWILALTALAALLRFLRPGAAPPGLNQDEAINAWSAWCLLRTGHDLTGTAWPVFYSHAVGDNRTTLFFYLLMPFEACFGLAAWSARLPAAFFGTWCVPLAAYVAWRWFGRGAGVAAAALLAVDPWALRMSRIALEGSVTPFLALLPLALLTASGLLIGGERRVRWPLALAAGLAAGVATYGYWSMRLWIPAWLLATALVAGPAAWRAMRVREHAIGLGAFAAGLALTFGPLLVRHLTDPAIARRAEMTRLWEPGTPVAEIARRVAERWITHFGPKFLWQSGDVYVLLQPAVDGAMHRFMIPLMGIGAAAVVLRWRSSLAARALAALVLVYPAGDLVARYEGVHELRSAAGIGGLVLLAAYGAHAAWGWLRARGRVPALAAAGVLAAVVAGSTLRSQLELHGGYDRREPVAREYYVDLGEAARWLRPRFERADAVYCTTQGMNEPWAILLVELGYDPARWLREPRERRVRYGWDVYTRIGKLYLNYELSARPAMEALQANGRDDLVYFIVRPGELGLEDPLVVFRRGGEELLWVCEVTL